MITQALPFQNESWDDQDEFSSPSDIKAPREKHDLSSSFWQVFVPLLVHSVRVILSRFSILAFPYKWFQEQLIIAAIAAKKWSLNACPNVRMGVRKFSHTSVNCPPSPLSRRGHKKFLPGDKLLTAGALCHFHHSKPQATSDESHKTSFIWLKEQQDVIQSFLEQIYRVAHLLWEGNMLTPNLKLRLADVSLSSDSGPMELRIWCQHNVLPKQIGHPVTRARTFSYRVTKLNVTSENRTEGSLGCTDSGNQLRLGFNFLWACLIWYRVTHQ